jgi:GNAT superfamily N-acetyltransferase
MAKLAPSAVTLSLAGPRLAQTDQCARIFVDARRSAFTWADPRQFLLEDFEAETEDEEIWVAECDGRVLGFASLWLENGGNFLHHLFVDPPEHRRGIGSLLLERSMKRLGRPATLKCLEANTVARAFYVKHGWRVVERGDSALGPYLLYLKED